jgi:glyoxylase-like metal-dependent hydrolase (beta-lactamase superfamily II)
MQEALIIDPVLENFKRDLNLIKDLNLKLKYIFETHIHADHITSAFLLKESTGAQICISANAQTSCADVFIDDNDSFKIGSFTLKALSTPGHTNTCASYHIENMVFTGDALMINGCGRTDFQEGSAKALYNSVREKLFTLPNETEVYPAHDYKGLKKSTIGEEKTSNSRLALDKSEADFIKIMKDLKLPPPKKIKKAVPRNLNCGQEN